MNDCAIARETGIPRSTIKDWRSGKARTAPRSGERCSHDFRALPPDQYCYLLGVYLGDGYVAPSRRGVWRLRVTLDAAYPGIVEETRVFPSTALAANTTVQ
jgi:hypothetical protein